MIVFELLHPKMTPAHLGFIPQWLSEDDPRAAKDQLDAGYSFAGGWRPFPGFTLHANNTLTYPGDPPMKPVAQAKLRDELILFYPHDWVVIVQSDRSFEACRMD